MAREVIFPRMELKLPPIEYCPSCGGHVEPIPREGRIRPVCGSCGFVVYVNPYPAACAVVFSGNRILLTKRSIEPKFGEWCLPGGFVEWGEPPDEAARRELEEETGLVAGRLDLVGAYSSISGECRHVLLLGYLAREWSGEPRAGDDASDVAWYDFDKLPHLAFTAHDQVVADVRGSGIAHAHSRG